MKPPREPGSLDVFLLALIDSGISTPYEFQRDAGVSIGASLPALRYLLSHKFVAKGRQGERRRMEYSLTRNGRALLKNLAISNLADNLAELSDLPSALRSVVLARYMGSRKDALRLLKQCQAEAKARSASDIPTQSESPAGMYRWMIAVRERHREKADLHAVSDIIERLSKTTR